MRNRSAGGAVAIGLVLLLAAGTVSAVVGGGAGGLFLAGFVLLVAVVLVITRGDLTRAGIGAAFVCAFTISWNGWYVGPIRPGDLLIPVSLLLFVAARPDSATRTPPWWVKQLLPTLGLITLFVVVIPIDQNYLGARVVLDAGGAALQPSLNPIGGDIAVAGKFVVALAILPMVFVAAVLADPRMTRRLPVAFTLGTALSGFAATVDHFHLADLGQVITGTPNAIDRQAGFTTQPNFLAAGLVLAIPFAIWLIARSHEPRRLLGLLCLLFLLLGIYASGSRGGAVCAGGTLLISLALLPRTRAILPAVVLAVATLTTAIAVISPSFGASILRVTRLSGNATSAGSDQVRALVGAQGVRDFYHSPIVGIGLHFSTEASQVYLQELAAGGVILFGSMIVYMFGALLTSLRLGRSDDLGIAAGAAVIATLALNFVEADLTDRFYYVPEAILIALAVALANKQNAASSDPTRPSPDPAKAAI